MNRLNTRSIVLTLSVFFVCGTLPATASVSNNQVQSQHIREADGTSGQNTNAGAGVKTGHIQDSAVTSTKIADGTIATSDLADGAVSDEKISGVISSSKISSLGLDADTVDGMHAVEFAPALHNHAQAEVDGLAGALDAKAELGHNHDALYQQKYGNVAVVALSGGDYADPVSAMNDISSWCGTPSAANPCLLKIMPGRYDVGGNSLHMSQFVDIEGSGENVTRIVGDVDGENLSNCLVAGASDSEIRHLTLENNGYGTRVVVKNNDASPKVSNVTIIASAPQSWGMVNWNSSALLMNVVILSTGSSQAVGITTDNGASVQMVNSKIAVSGGSSNYAVTGGASIAMKSVELQASGSYIGHNYAIYDTMAKIVDSKVIGTITGNSAAMRLVANTEISGTLAGGTWRCIGVYDSEINPISCP